MNTPNFDDFEDAPVIAKAPVTVKPFKAEPGIFYDLSNEQYHKSDGISCSGLKQILDGEADYVWSKTCPQDPEALRQFDLGTAFHCIIGEYDQFDDRYIIAPEFNRRSNQGKADEAEFLAEVAHENKIVLSFEDNKQLRMMRESVYAHPVCRVLLEMEGHAEASIYWTDPDTKQLLKIRPDKFVRHNGQNIIIDFKSIGQFDRMEDQVENLQYHMQDAMYSDGYEKHFGVAPDFYFIFCSTTLNCGRYPATCKQLPSDWKQSGHQLYRDALNKYHQARINNDWLTIPELTRPRWAK